MLSSLIYQGKIAQVVANFTWGEDLDGIYSVISKYFDNFNDNGFHAHADEIALRAELADIATLQRLTAQLQALPAHGIVLQNLGLRDLPEERRNATLYALALMFGYPTSTDQRTGRVAWDVKARPPAADENRFVTFSERIGSADMHTDSSFYPMPEEQFMLYVVAAAQCDGGHSLLIDGEAIYTALNSTAAGAAAYALLRSTPVPFRVPSVYAAGDEGVEYYVAPVFGPARRAGERFTLRWRYDSIQRGLEACPEMSSPALVDALEQMHHVAEVSAVRYKRQLPTDTLMLADNHRTLHGRTTYTDERRHLIRIRMSDVPNAQRIGPSGVVRD